MKNKIFLGLILGIFLIGIVSASITGYLTARDGGEIREAGYTATLKKVEGTTAIVSVQTPTGDTELVRVAEGETAQVGDAQISADNLRSGNLFRRGGGNIGLNISNISGATQIKVSKGISLGGGSVGGATGGQCGCFDPINAFDMINARCKWHQTDALNTNGVIPNEYCNNLGNDYICTDTLNVDYVTSQGSVEGVVPTDCNSMSLAQGLFIRCCDGRPFD